MDHDISRHITDRIRIADEKEERTFFADYLDRRVKLMRKFSTEDLNDDDLAHPIFFEDTIKSINKRFKFDQPSINIETRHIVKGTFKTYVSALELIFENLLINTHEANQTKKAVTVKIAVAHEAEGSNSNIRITYEEVGGIGFKTHVCELEENGDEILVPVKEKIEEWKKCILSQYDISKDDRGMGFCLISTAAKLLSGNYEIKFEGLKNGREKARHIVNISRFSYA